MSAAEEHSPDWYADPSRRHQLRFWDGSRWTDRVSDNGVEGSDPPTPTQVPAQTSTRTSTPAGWLERLKGLSPNRDPATRDLSLIERAAQKFEPAWEGDGTLMNEPILVISQQSKWIEVAEEYEVHDRHGNQLGAVRHVSQNMAKKALHLMGRGDQFMTHRLELIDAHGNVVLGLKRGPKGFTFMDSHFQVTNAAGQEIGSIYENETWTDHRYALVSHGVTYGWIDRPNVVDHAGVEVARYAHPWLGIVELFTAPSIDVVQFHYRLPSPLRELVVAGAIADDFASERAD